MDNKIASMYRNDVLLLILFIIFVWVILSLVASAVSTIAPNPTVKTIALAAGAVAGIFATSALLGVLSHLKKNKQQLYNQDISCQCK